MTESQSLCLTTRLISVYVSTNSIPVGDLPNLIRAVYGTITTLERDVTLPAPAVSVHASITPEYLVCLEDGKRLLMLKRYLRSRYGLTPEEYRRKWDLPSDYPMTAPNYARKRSKIAREIGLGKTGTKHRRTGANPERRHLR